MSLSLIFAAIWAIAATVVALLPMRLQYLPGLTLLILAPLLIGFIGWQHGGWIAVLGLLGFASMFRHPLRYLWKVARGKPVDVPPGAKEPDILKSWRKRHAK